MNDLLPPITIVLVLVLAPAAGGAAGADTIRPGYWESVNKVVYPISSTKIDRRCVTAKDVAKFLMGPSNHIYACAYPTQTIGHGQIRFAGECTDKKGRKVQISGHGTYTPTSLRMTADLTFKLAGIPISAEASTDARRLGDVCPAEATK
ncbi:MAG TPA: DUF3617 family protein [Caulobacteraceae bacterium]